MGVHLPNVSQAGETFGRSKSGETLEDGLGMSLGETFEDGLQ